MKLNLPILKSAGLVMVSGIIAIKAYTEYGISHMKTISGFVGFFILSIVLYFFIKKQKRKAI